MHRHPVTLVGLFIGVVLAPLFAYSDLPAPSMYNQLLAIFGFGLVLIGLSLGGALHAGWRLLDGGSLLLLLLLLITLLSPVTHGAPLSGVLSCGALLVTAFLTLQAARAVRWEMREDILTMFSLALVLAGLLSTVVGAVQFFQPGWTDDLFIAHTNNEGRAVGNVRQPNQLASLLLWSCVGAVWLAQSGWLARRLGTPRRAVVALGVLLWLLVLGILFSASRTGTIGILLVVIWALVDAVLARSGRARLTRSVRIAILLMPVMWGLGWCFVSWWAETHGLAFFGQTRLTTQGAQSQERLMILRDTFELVKQYPWAGTGWGQFNFAWTMTPFPHRYTAFVDHTHNVFLQFVVELGVPLGAVASLLLLAAAGLAAWRSVTDRQGAAVCAFMIVLVIGLHSQSEYPLWYAYFLLPTAFAYGLCVLRNPAERPVRDPKEDTPVQRKDFALAGVLMVILVPWAVIDYLTIVHIYSPRPGAAPLVERLAAGDGSPLFDLHADHAIATVLPPGPLALQAAHKASHRLIDARLMVAWARSLNAAGQTDKARYLADRLREFHHPLGDAFFKECELAEEAHTTLPFQCTPPSRNYLPSEMR
ncbi:O-antigen ligase [Roseateles sp. YR242]|nr:O-antigen ligase [Roseateles sp. YR242]